MVEDGSIISNDNSHPSDEAVATEQPLEEREQPTQSTQPGTESPEEGAETGDTTDGGFDWSGWGSILDIPGEDDGIDWGNWFDDVNREDDGGLPVWRPLFGDSSWNEEPGYTP